MEDRSEPEASATVLVSIQGKVMHTSLLALTLLVPSAQPTPDFATEVLPVLTRAGCNSGACHGAAVGRGGFKLSLWGSDPTADHLAIVRELEGRRINLVRPEESLLLLKPTGGIRHGGSIRLDPEGEGAGRILNWIRAGGQRGGTRQLADLKVIPGEKVLDRPGDGVQVKVIAHFRDGKGERIREGGLRVDVTRWAVLQADDPGTVQVDEGGTITVRRRGQVIVVVRFLDRVAALRLLVPFGPKRINPQPVARHHFIDEEVASTLRTLRLPVASLADDATFLRRVSLDLTGTLPTPEQVRAFLADDRVDRRARVIDRLLASRDFVDYWTFKWGNLLQIHSRALGKEGVQAFHNWVRAQLARNTPMDQMARDMLTALGDSARVGPANFARVPRTAREQAEYVSRVFMGVRLRCANCHNHPLDRWTQDDYHGMAALFARLERGKVVRLAARGEVIHPRSGEPARPRLPGVRFLPADKDNREILATWLTSPKNPYFARAMVNRLWCEMFGRGLVEDPDDHRTTNPPTHPALLDRLAQDFVDHQYDLRHTLRIIANSASYQRGRHKGATRGKGDGRFYAAAPVRPLPAEVLADALTEVTGVADRYGNLPLGTRAITLPDPQIPAPSLDVLGRCSRKEPCTAERMRIGGMRRVLHLINGPLLNRKITASRGRLRRLIKSGRSNQEIVKEFYLRALSRLPNKQEHSFWSKQLHGCTKGTKQREALEDFLWALLTSKEFTTNH